MRFSLVGLSLFFAFSVFAQEKLSLKNDREGKTFYQSRSARKAQKKAIKNLNSQDIVKAFTETLGSTSENNLCSFDLNTKLTARLKAIHPKFKELEGALYHLRARNEIDDVVLKILLRAIKVEKTDLNLPKHEENLWLPRDNAKVSDMLKAIVKAEKSLAEGCLEEVYRTVYGEILKVDKKIKSFHIEALLVEAYKTKQINFKTYSALEKARVNKLNENGLDIKGYVRKIKSLRTHFPLRDPTEKSEFVTAKFDKKGSRRQRLLQQYSDLQIMLMGDVIKKLRSRLDSDKVEILVYANPHEVQEIIPLDPMERFRFAIKVLRKEMANLSLNTYFNGVSPDYMDIMTAAYETGIIPAIELQELAGLEQIWNPKKTFWEKAKVWVQTFGSVASIAIPPPYGFIPSLALVVIEFTVGNKQQTEDNASLF